MIAAWIARNFQDRDRLDCACKWQDRLGRPFTEKIEQRLLRANDLDEIWTRVWRLFCLVEPVLHSNTTYYEMQKRLASRAVLYSDLHKAVSLLAPSVKLGQRSDPAASENDGRQPTRVGHIIWVHMGHLRPARRGGVGCCLVRIPRPCHRDSQPRYSHTEVCP